MKKSEANIEDLRNQTVSWGTHRPDDLIPKFMAVLKEYGKEAYDKYVSENPEVEDWKKLDDETKGWVVDELFDLLDGIAPEDCYFGAHPGDGADFGFWQVDESKKNEAKYDGPITLYGSTRYDDAEEAQKFLDGISGGQVKVSKDRNGDMLIVSIAGSDEDIDAFLEVYKDNYDNFETDCDANVMGWTSPGDLPYLTVQGRKELTGESKKSDGLADGDAALLKMQKSLKQYADKTTGEIAADIRYDVATALDMPADEVDDVMLNFGLDNIYILRSKGLSPKGIAQKILKSTKSKKSEAMQNEGWTGGFSSRQEILDLMDGGIFTDDWKLEKRFGNWGCYVNQKTGRPIVLQMLIEPDNDHGWAYKSVTSDMGPYDINIQAAKWLKPRLEKWVEENPDKSKDVPDYEWEWIEKCLGKAAATKSKKDIAASLVKGDKVKLIDTVANGAVVTFIDMITPGKMRILHNGREMSCKTSYIDRKVDAPAESKKSKQKESAIIDRNAGTVTYPYKGSMSVFPIAVMNMGGIKAFAEWEDELYKAFGRISSKGIMDLDFDTIVGEYVNGLTPVDVVRKANKGLYKKSESKKSGATAVSKQHESKSDGERAVDDYDTLIDGLKELGFEPSSNVRNGKIYPYRTRFTATKDGIKYGFTLNEDRTGEYLESIEVVGGSIYTGDPNDKDARVFKSVGEVLDALKQVDGKKSEEMTKPAIMLMFKDTLDTYDAERAIAPYLDDNYRGFSVSRNPINSNGLWIHSYNKDPKQAANILDWIKANTKNLVWGKLTEAKKSESLTLKQKELKNMARYGEATDITTISDAEAKELKKKGIETVGISRGAYGMNGALLRDNEGNKYVITARSSNLFYFV